MKKLNKKGFTLAELLIVVAVIAVLVAVAIPTFSNQLEKSRQGVDISNLRGAFAAARIAQMDQRAADAAIGAGPYYYDPDSGELLAAEPSTGYGKALTASVVVDKSGLSTDKNKDNDPIISYAVPTKGKVIKIEFEQKTGHTDYSIKSIGFAALTESGDELTGVPTNPVEISVTITKDESSGTAVYSVVPAPSVAQSIGGGTTPYTYSTTATDALVAYNLKLNSSGEIQILNATSNGIAHTTEGGDTISITVTDSTADTPLTDTFDIKLTVTPAA